MGTGVKDRWAQNPLCPTHCFRESKPGFPSENSQVNIDAAMEGVGGEQTDRPGHEGIQPPNHM